MNRRGRGIGWAALGEALAANSSLRELEYVGEVCDACGVNSHRVQPVEVRDQGGRGHVPGPRAGEQRVTHKAEVRGDGVGLVRSG